MAEECEFESFPEFILRIDSDGDYELEGDKQEFFANFVASAAESPKDTDSYSVTITDDSPGRAGVLNPSKISLTAKSRPEVFLGDCNQH